MVNFNAKALNELVKEILKHGNDFENARTELLKAGAEVIQKAHKQEAEATFNKTGRGTGDLANSIGIDNYQKATVDVYPMGNNRRGQRNATVGFVQEYGRGIMQGTAWMTNANQKCANEVYKAVQSKWSEIIEKR